MPAALLPDEPEAVGLLALLLLQHARRDAGSDATARLVLLPDQDRSRWDADAIAEGLRAASAAPAGRRRAGPYLLQAAIAAEHARARGGRGHRLAPDRRALRGAGGAAPARRWCG